MSDPVNIAYRLRQSAEAAPYQKAVIFPESRDRAGRVTYSHLTFQQLDRETDRLARGLRRLGIAPGTRLVLMVPPSLEFVALTFALFKAGMTAILIDPGMGRKNILKCLEEIRPEGFLGIPLVQVARLLNRKRFPHAVHNVTVRGKRLGWGGITYTDLLGGPWEPTEITPTASTDLAAIIFTSGSTGPPKGVRYEHGMFDAQVDLLREFYEIQPGEVDLPGFPLFALFNSAMQVTTVIPDMNPTRPADVDPQKILEAIENHGVTQAFGSPALWNTVSRYCDREGITIPSLKRVLSAGAPVPVPVLERMNRILAEPTARVHTPYGCTECLPIASISDDEVRNETAEQTARGAGTCVGRLFPEMRVRIIRITDHPFAGIDDTEELPTGEIGEILVRGPVATKAYEARDEATRMAKVPDDDGFWHRMGDVGYRDERDRLWFCGRKAHIVSTTHGPLYTIPCEAIFNNHPDVYRSALVGIGDPAAQTPVIIIEPETDRFPKSKADRKRFADELRRLAENADHTRSIREVLFHRSLPVDIRHNVKIFREKLAPWAAENVRTEEK